jgi:hypothetical protein
LGLRRAGEPVARIIERTSALGAKLGPVLLQLPERLEVDLLAARGLPRAFLPAVRFAVHVDFDNGARAFAVRDSQRLAVPPSRLFSAPSESSERW